MGDDYVVYRRSQTYQTSDGGSEVLVATQLGSADGNTSVSLNYGLGTTNVTSRNPNAQERTVTTTFPGVSQTVTLYTNGLLARVTHKDADGTTTLQTDYAYDAHGRLWKTIDARNGATTYGYNAADLVATNTSPAPGSGQSSLVTKTFYDTALRATNVIQPDNTSTFTSYYTNGLAKKSWGSRVYAVEYAYDYAGRMTNKTIVDKLRQCSPDP